MKRAITGAITLVGLVLVILSVMGVILLGSNGTWHSELKVPAGRTAVVVQPALASVLGPAITVRAEATLGEICGVLKELWGDYREPARF